ncbi:MAG: LytTR family DNA-binding domain-containing protein [bacterium]
MTFRVVVADDEAPARSGIKARLASHADIVVVAECRDGEETVGAIREYRPDLLFLDIQMPGTSGFDALDQLAEDEHPLIIFLTAHDQYALRAFDVHAVDYLLKPIDDRRFAEALAHARLMRTARTTQYAQRFATRRGGEILFVSAADVDWIESCGDYAALHTARRTHLLRETLQELERRLDPSQFVRIHRSTIVRLDRIRTLTALTNRDGLARLTDGTELRVSRTYRNRLPGNP